MTSTRIPLTMYQQRSDKSSKLYNLINLIESLEDLMVLHIDLKLRIKLDDFIQEDTTEVCIHLLDWCTNSDEVDALCDNFLLSFILRHNLDKVGILMNYCIIVVSNLKIFNVQSPYGYKLLHTFHN